MTRLLKALWADETGAVLATEYLTLGSIVALGSAAGLTAVKDSMVEEYKDFGNSIREVGDARRAAMAPMHKSAGSSRVANRSQFDIEDGSAQAFVCP